ncbi:MAG TPA: hypothetical protein V6C99_06670 [Oculatellaceae cyanobacterium]
MLTRFALSDFTIRYPKQTLLEQCPPQANTAYHADVAGSSVCLGLIP